MVKSCYLCKSSEDDELVLGKFYNKYGLSVHYYCLLLSSNLVQNGLNDTAGIFGFLEQDIRRENERTRKCRCYICKKMHANVSCCSKKCLRTFHTVCGIKNRCLSHYTGTYQSWCSSHIPLERDEKPHGPAEPCSICYDDMGIYDRITSIRAPCCRNGWFHQRCVAQYAQSAGYFFKCPLCNNEEKFLSEIPLRGVFVPERDAAWELEPNAFQEQLVRPTACDAEVCKCTKGRTENRRHWKLICCGSCGSTCRHRDCMESSGSRSYVCQLCRPIVGERISSAEGDDSHDSDDDTACSSSSSMCSREGREETDTTERPTPGSESGVHCSSSDDTLGNIRRTSVRRFRIQSVDSDSDQSDESMIQMRRCVTQTTRKRVRRILSSESYSQSCTSVEDENPNKAGMKIANEGTAFARKDRISSSDSDKRTDSSDRPILRKLLQNTARKNRRKATDNAFDALDSSVYLLTNVSKAHDENENQHNFSPVLEKDESNSVITTRRRSGDSTSESFDNMPSIKRRRLTKLHSESSQSSNEANYNRYPSGNRKTTRAKTNSDATSCCSVKSGVHTEETTASSKTTELNDNLNVFDNTSSTSVGRTKAIVTRKGSISSSSEDSDKRSETSEPLVRVVRRTFRESRRKATDMALNDLKNPDRMPASKTQPEASRATDISKEKNISPPKGSAPLASEPPAQAKAHFRNEDMPYNNTPNRLQQSILKYVTLSTPENQSGNGVSDVSVEGTPSPSLNNSSINTSSDTSSNKQKSKSKKRAKNTEKGKGQHNLLNYFSRC